jgi:ABC-type oligopeptide transport system substrate-binding subunit
VGIELPIDAAPPEQQVYRYADYEGKHLNKSGNGYDGFASENVYEPLAWIDGDGTPHPAAAERWETSADGLTWTFHLRRGAKWSDGTPVTVADWINAYRRMVDPKLANPQSWFYYPIKNAEAIHTGKISDITQLGVRAADDNTLVFDTEAVTPHFVLVLCHRPIIVPKHMIDKHGETWCYNVETALSNGPFLYKEWNKGKNLIMTPNPYYNGPHKPKLEKLILAFVPQSNAPLLQMYKADEIDGIDTVTSANDLSLALSDPDLKRDLETFAAFTTFYLFFNTTKPPFDNLKVRQAISHAVDRIALTEQVMQNLAKPAYSMLPNGFMCSQNSDPAIQAIQAYDPALAKRLLAEAGYPNGQGFPALELWTRQGQYVREAEAIQNMLKTTLGISVTPKDVERALFMDRLAKHDITFGLFQWKMDIEDPTDMLDWWASQSRHPWKNTEFNELLAQARVMLDPAKRCQLYNRAERILIEDVGGVFVGYPTWGVMYKPWVAGVRARKDGVRVYYRFRLTEAYIKKH